MNQHLMINDMSANMRVEGYYIASSINCYKTKTGNPYLSVTLQDISGTVGAKLWNYNGSLGESDSGRVYYLEGTVTEYNGANQLNLDYLRPAEQMEESDYMLEDLLPSAPIDLEYAYENVWSHLISMEDDDYREICVWIMNKYKKEFCTYPAAKSVHHCYRGGLLVHTCDMMELASYMSRYYYDIDGNLLVAGVFLHDIGKIFEFVLSDLGLVATYSAQGNLMGHPVIGAQIVGEAAQHLGTSQEKLMLLQHLIPSHHGQPEYGAAVKPLCIESELLSCIDMIDSRCEIYRQNLSTMEKNTFSNNIYALGKRIYCH